MLYTYLNTGAPALSNDLKLSNIGTLELLQVDAIADARRWVTNNKRVQVI